MFENRFFNVVFYGIFVIAIVWTVLYLGTLVWVGTKAVSNVGQIEKQGLKSYLNEIWEGSNHVHRQQP